MRIVGVLNMVGEVGGFGFAGQRPSVSLQIQSVLSGRRDWLVSV